MQACSPSIQTTMPVARATNVVCFLRKVNCALARQAGSQMVSVAATAAVVVVVV